MYEDKDVPDEPRRRASRRVHRRRCRGPTARRTPHDEGSFADHDVVSDHRHPEAEGSFEDAVIPGEDEDVEAIQVERAHHGISEPDDVHPAHSEPDVPPADPI